MSPYSPSVIGRMIADKCVSWLLFGASSVARLVNIGKIGEKCFEKRLKN